MMKKSCSKRFASILLVLVMILSIMGLSACSKPQDNAVATTAAPATTAETKAEATTESKEPTQAPFDPMAKYNPEITIKSCIGTGGTQKFPEGDDINNNVWTREFKNVLGINLVYDFVIDGGQLATKLNTVAAANALPEAFACSSAQLMSFAKAGQLADLGEVFDKYASDMVKKNMTEFPEGFESGKYEGKLVGVPDMAHPGDSAGVIWLRSDWMKKLGLSQPKTMDELVAIMDAFVNKDPDGNNKKDTWGMALNNSLYGIGAIDGFCNGYGAYPNIWVKDSSGQIVYGSIQPEMKSALKALSELYKKGFIDREFGSKDSGKLNEDINKNKIGVYYGVNWNGYWPLNGTFNGGKTPEASWDVYPIVSATDKPAVVAEGWPIWQYFAVSKNCKNPEAMIKMMNLKMERMYGNTADYAKFGSDGSNEPFNYVPFTQMPFTKNIAGSVQIFEAFKTNDTTGMSAEAKTKYNSALKWYKDKNFEGFGDYAQAQAFLHIKAMTDNNQVMLNEIRGSATPTQADKGESLLNMEKAAFIKIITGKADCETEFNKFVEEWKKLGGEQITKEVNEKYNKK